MSFDLLSSTLNIDKARVGSTPAFILFDIVLDKYEK